MQCKTSWSEGFHRAHFLIVDNAYVNNSTQKAGQGLMEHCCSVQGC